MRIAYSSRTADGEPGHPDCVAALDDAVALCASLGHEMVEADLPGLDDAAGAAIGTVFHSATAWIVAYWTRHRGREPGPDELEPLTRAYWEAGKRVGAADYLLAVEDLQAFARTVARFLAGFDAWLTPTLSEPPALLGEITSTAEDPLRAAQRGGRTVGYPLVVANITGNPAMSVPMSWNTAGLPIGVHVLGRYGDEATLFRLAGQLETARPWAQPATPHPRRNQLSRAAGPAPLTGHRCAQGRWPAATPSGSRPAMMAGALATPVRSGIHDRRCGTWSRSEHGSGFLNDDQRRSGLRVRAGGRRRRVRRRQGGGCWEHYAGAGLTGRG